MTPLAAYLLVLGWASIPFAPAEPVLVGAGSYAATGALHLPLVVAAAATGSYCPRSHLINSFVRLHSGRRAVRLHPYALALETACAQAASIQ